MDFVGGLQNNVFVETLVSQSIHGCDEVLVAVAYCNETRLFDICQRAGRRVTYYGRIDPGVPVTSQVLSWFLHKASPNYSCRLIREVLHAKVIWLKGAGVYIGSANLTDKGWMTNLEAGVFLTEADIQQQGMAEQLESFFCALAERSTPLTAEIVTHVRTLEEKRRSLGKEEFSIESWFDQQCPVPESPNLAAVDDAKAHDCRRVAFLKEWGEALQLLRDIGVRLRNYRPAWVDPAVADGVHVDQFLHAFYYQRVRDGNRQPFDEFFERNRRDPEAALVEQVEWWRAGDYPYEGEDEFIRTWAPSSRALLAKDRLRSLTEAEFIQLCSQVHAIRDHAIKLPNKMLGMPEGQHQNAADKIAAFGHWLYPQKSVEGESVLSTTYHVLYGGSVDDVPDRLWTAVHDPRWQIGHFKMSSLGEMIGWAMPDRYPPRNSRTSKALRALGNDVRIY